MTEIRNFKLVLVIEYWYLRFICDLVLGVWHLDLFVLLFFKPVTIIKIYFLFIEDLIC
jgi:hypothetical protein